MSIVTCVTTSGVNGADKTHTIKEVVDDVIAHGVQLFPQSLCQFWQDLRFILPVMRKRTFQACAMGFVSGEQSWPRELLHTLIQKKLSDDFAPFDLVFSF